MKNVPKYLMPRIAAAPANAETPASAEGEEGKATFVPFRKPAVRGRGSGRGRGRGGSSSGRGGKKKSDPLKKFGR